MPASAKTTDDIPFELRALTVDQFCSIEGFCRATYFKLKRLGVGPEETTIPGTTIIRITPEARAAWHQRMKEYAASEAGKLDAERRRHQRIEASQRSIASPRHASKQQKNKNRRGRRR